MNDFEHHKVVDTFFIHNCFGSFFSGVLKWFSDDFYPRFNFKVIGTYDKALEFLTKKKQTGIDQTLNLLPSISLDPMLDFSHEERAGRFLWQHSRYAPGLGVRISNSIDLREQDVLVTPVFSRYYGTFEVTFWLASVYELMDFRVSLLQFTGGFQRWCRPKYFWTYLILPDEVENHKTNENVKLDWGNTYSDIIHVETINKHRRAVPIALDPIWRLESFSDSSTKYGGDSIAEYKLNASFTYEVNIPTYIVISEHINPSLTLSLSLGSTHTAYPLFSPLKVLESAKDILVDSKCIDSNFNIYAIDDDNKDSNFILKFNDDSISYPISIPIWNYILGGTLKCLDHLDCKTEVIDKDDIIYIPQYKEEYLPYIRKAKGIINGSDRRASEFYSKCNILKKPFISFLTDDEKDSIMNLNGSDVTIDFIRKELYSGILNTYINNTDKQLAYKILEDLKKRDPESYNEAIEKTKKIASFTGVLPEHKATENITNMTKRLIQDFCDGVDFEFKLPNTIDEKDYESFQLYINSDLQIYKEDYEIINNNIIRFFHPPPKGSNIYIGSELMVIRESRLVAIYEFTEDDINNSNDIFIELPEDLTNKDDFLLVSYIGKMEYGKDYEIDFNEKNIKIKLQPIADEIIQIFYYF